jgi:hypothetical protein
MDALRRLALVSAAIFLAAGCSPEARRTRDGGPGADPGNKSLTAHAGPDPRAADTTLWPGRALTPVERFARGDLPAPSFPAEQQHTLDRSQAADPRRQTGSSR